jgi:tetratricopeptide (TPR) repeat protein
MPNQEELLDQIRATAIAAVNEDREAAAVELLHAYLKHRPGDGYMWFRFGNALRLIGLVHEAEHALLTALETAESKHSGWILRELALVQTHSGRLAEAEQSFAQACNDPEVAAHGATWILRGANLASATQLQAAEDCHRRALTFHDENVDRDEAYLNLGYVLRAQGRYAEAAEAFQHALEITPDYPLALEPRASLAGIDDAIAATRRLES